VVWKLLWLLTIMLATAAAFYFLIQNYLGYIFQYIPYFHSHIYMNESR